MRGRIIALLLALMFMLQLYTATAAESRSYQPPANTPVIPWKRFSIEYAVRIMGNALAAKVEFYITTDGGMTWKKYGEDPDLVSPMIISVPSEGTYGFVTAVSTNIRPALPPRPGTRPDRFVIVDRTPPEAKWISPNAEVVLITESGIELAWVSSDKHLGLTPVSIEYSTDGGNFWLPLRDDLPAKGSIVWNPPFLEGQTDISLRLIVTDLAGNKRIVKNKTSFSLDNTAPVVTIIGPASSGSFKFDIDYTATDDQSGVSNIELYYTVDGGTEWYYFGPDVDLRSPISFSSPAAKEVGLYIVATDKNGNKTPAPARGAMPMAYVTLDIEPPQVSILPPFTTSGGVVAKDDVIDIRWNASDANIKEGTTIIQLSRDGGATWTDLAYDKPANGSWQWVPRESGSNLLLKVSVSDVMGNVGTAISMPFAVDEKRPTMEFESITPVNGGEEVVLNSVQTYSEPADDLWAPPVPSTVELESETITDLPAGAPVRNTQDSFVAEDIEISTPQQSLSSTEINIPAPATEDSVPTLEDNFANNQIPDEDFAPVTTETEADSLNLDSFDFESTDTVAEDTTVVQDQTDDLDLGDLDLDSIPDLAPPPATETIQQESTEVVQNTSNTFEESLFTEEDLSDIPEPGSLQSSETTLEEEVAIPPIPDIGDASSDTFTEIADISIPESGQVAETVTLTQEEDLNIPDISPPTETVVEEDEFGFGPVDEVVEEVAQIGEKLDLPLDLDEALPTTPEVSAENLLLQARTAFEDDENYDLAESLAKQVIDLDPNNSQAYAIVASVLTEKGSYDSAFDYAHRAINLAPESAEYLQILGYAQYKKAVEINKMLGQSELTPSQQDSLTSQLMVALDQAQEAYAKMISSTNDIDVKEGYYRLAQVDYFKATRTQTDQVQMDETLKRAIANYQKAYSIGEPDYREVLQIGICYYRLNDFAQAEQWLEKAQELAPVDRTPKEAFFYLALISEKTNRPQEALAFWSQVANFYPDGSSYKKLAQTRIEALSGVPGM